MMETEFLIPLDDSVQAAVACICALGSLGGEQAEERMKRLSDNADGRIRLYATKCRLESPSGPLLARCRLAPMAENESWLRDMRDNLVDPEEACRFAFLDIARKAPAAELFAVIAGRLTDASHRVRVRAAECLKVGATQDETQLRALFPALEYDRQPRTELSETEDLLIRTWAIEALYFDHQSDLVQAKLLSVFDRPALGAKKALKKAFSCCSGKAQLKKDMLECTQNACPDNRISAWYVLSTLKDPTLRPQFLALLEEEPALVCAGVQGLSPMLEVGDIPALQRCVDRWAAVGL